MSKETPAKTATETPSPAIRAIENTLELEGASILRALERMKRDKAPWTKALSILNETLNRKGKIIVTGIGKSGKIAQKISATLSSTGSHAAYLHPTEALHGDLGFVREEDCVLALSYTGNTEELLKIMPSLHARKTPVICICGKKESQLAKESAVFLDGSVEQVHVVVRDDAMVLPVVAVPSDIFCAIRRANPIFDRAAVDEGLRRDRRVPPHVCFGRGRATVPVDRGHGARRDGLADLPEKLDRGHSAARRGLGGDLEGAAALHHARGNRIAVVTKVGAEDHDARRGEGGDGGDGGARGRSRRRGGRGGIGRRGIDRHPVTLSGARRSGKKRNHDWKNSGHTSPRPPV